jgi:recombination protein RecA
MIPLASAQLVRAVHLEHDADSSTTSAHLSHRELAGRFSEFSGSHDSCCLTLACSLLLEAQQSRIPAVWVSATSDCFYPPDLAANGVDLSALPVVCLPDVLAAGKATDWLIRSGAFGLVILDLGEAVYLPPALQGRLVQLANRYDTALVCLTHKNPDQLSMGSLVSLRGVVVRERLGPGRFQSRTLILKDKRKGPGWKYTENCYGPDGLR